jgi:hypothetical protein
VARNHILNMWHEVSLGQMEVSAADPASANS